MRPNGTRTKDRWECGCGCEESTQPCERAERGCGGAGEVSYDGTGAIDRRTGPQPDRAYQLRCRAALESFERAASSGRGGPQQRRNRDEEGIAGALETNPDGTAERTGLWCYSKGLKRRDDGAHAGLGEPEPAAYESLLKALETSRPADFEQIRTTPVADPAVDPRKYRRLTNPQAGIDYDLEGGPSHGFAPRPAPSVTNAISSAEIGENYWMAVLRDAHFKYYMDAYPAPDPTSALVQKAADHLSSKNHGGDFKRFHWPPVSPIPTQETCCSGEWGLGREHIKLPAFRAGKGKVTPGVLFRGFDAGSLKGPYLSQFLLRGNTDNYISGVAGGLVLHVLQTPGGGWFTDGTNPDNQRQKTVLGRNTLADPDFMTSVPDWLDVQSGLDTTGRDHIDVDGAGKPVLRFIRNLRDLATYVHLCDVTSPYVNAAFIMYGENAAAMNAQRVALDQGAVPPPLPFPMNPGNPYSNAGNVGVSRTQVGFATFDISHYVSLVNEIAWRAHKVQWFQKWQVHRRMRPEEFGGRIHFQLAGGAGTNRYPAIANAEILDALQANPGLGEYYSHGGGTQFQTYLLPQVFPEGSPTHPAYGQGHGALGGACVTILKAFFDDRAHMTEPGSALLPPVYIADDNGQNLVAAPHQTVLTVGGELDKLAANIALGRDAAGVHWRTDYMEGVLLGEAFAISLLLDQSVCYELQSSGRRVCSFNERRGIGTERAPFFEFTKFNGTRIRIADGRVRSVNQP